MDAVDAASAVLIDLTDGVLDAGLLEVCLLLSGVGVEGFLVEGVGEDPRSAGAICPYRYNDIVSYLRCKFNLIF